MFHAHSEDDRVLLTTYGRRQFAKQLALSCACLGVLSAPAFAANSLQDGKKPNALLPSIKLSEATLQNIRLLTRSRFAAVLNDNFETIYGAGDVYVLQLVEVADLPMPQPAYSTKKSRKINTEAENEKSFVLRFRGTFETQLPQKIYKLRHPVLGEHEIFLVQVGLADKETGARIYEAVFNRHIE
jgi:hypothetical protein